MPNVLDRVELGRGRRVPVQGHGLESRTPCQTIRASFPAGVAGQKRCGCAVISENRFFSWYSRPGSVVNTVRQGCWHFDEYQLDFISLVEYAVQILTRTIKLTGAENTETVVGVKVSEGLLFVLEDRDPGTVDVVDIGPLAEQLRRDRWSGCDQNFSASTVYISRCRCIHKVTSRTVRENARV
jgi:hypothetical protein